MAGLVETKPERYRALVDPLVAEVISFPERVHPPEVCCGIALLTHRGVVLYEYGQLVSHAGNAGPSLCEALERSSLLPPSAQKGAPATDDKSDDAAGKVLIAGEPFVIWNHERSVRFYAATRRKAWGLCVRKLSVGVLVVVHTKFMHAQVFLPKVERFCDSLVWR